MKYALSLLAILAAVEASPFPQAVTASIAPKASAPSGCMTNYSGTFGIAVMNITSSHAANAKAASATSGAPVSTIADGQPQAATSAVSTIGDGQPQAPKSSAAAVSTISDGQPQAPKSSAAAVSTIADGQPQAPKSTAAAVSTISDGQPQAPKSSAAVVSTIADGQPQAPKTVAPVSQISDGQIQATSMMTMTMAPISQIGDGQIQATYVAVSTIADGQPQAPKSSAKASAVSTISDGQPQAPKSTASKASAVSTISDGQPQAPTKTAVSTISDGQPQATGSAVGAKTDGQPTASATGSAPAAMGTMMVACQTNSTLEITMKNGILTDNKGRTGYIASNYQFQFDGPPQAGAIYTAGFSVCGNGSLALGGSTTFYQCLSGDFYNLYDRNWAAQCVPITINVVSLTQC